MLNRKDPLNPVNPVKNFCACKKQKAPRALPHKGLREELTESLKLVDDVCSEHPGIVQMSVATLIAVLDRATPDTLAGE